MKWYDNLNTGLLILIIFVVITRFNYFFSERKWWLFYFLTYAITEWTGTYFSLITHNNLDLYNISRPVQFLLLLAYFSNILNFGRVKTCILAGAGIVSCFFFLFFKTFDQYASFQVVVNGAVITLLSVLYFYKIILLNESVDLRNTDFWYCSSLFIFFGTNLLVDGSMDYLIKHDPPTSHKLFYVMVINSYIFYLFVLYAVIPDSIFRKLHL